MPRSHLSPLLLLAPALGLLACESPLSPERTAGSYALAVWVTHPTTPDVVLLQADTITLLPDGEGSRVQWVAYVSEPMGAVTRERQVRSFDYSLDGETVGLQYTCTPGTVCTAMAQREWFDVEGGARALRARAGTRHRYDRVAAP